MISLEFPDGDKPNNLPLLTELADGETLDELPTLTEIVTARATELADTAVPDSNGFTPANDFPLLLESSDIVQYHLDPTISAPPLISEAKMQQLEQRLAAHFETVFKNKLSLQLEQLQELALHQAVTELKAELPGLLRDALADRTEPL